MIDTKQSDGYVSFGSSPSVVSSDKQSFVNLIHLWIQSDYPKQSLYPQLQMSKNEVQNTPLPHFHMLDEITYKTPDTNIHNLFAQPPVYLSPFITSNTNTKQLSQYIPISIISQSDDTDMVFTARITVEKQCPTCVIILKQTYHPNWHVTVNGKTATAIDVFPSYVGVRLENPGTYTVVFSYQPSLEKKLLVLGGFLFVIGSLFIIFRKKYS